MKGQEMTETRKKKERKNEREKDKKDRTNKGEGRKKRGEGKKERREAEIRQKRAKRKKINSVGRGPYFLIGSTASSAFENPVFGNRWSSTAVSYGDVISNASRLALVLFLKWITDSGHLIRGKRVAQMTPVHLE